MKKVLSLTMVLAIILQLVMIAPASALSDQLTLHAGEQTYPYPTTYDHAFAKQATPFTLTDEMLENSALRIYLRRNSGTLTDLILYLYDGTSVFGVNLLNYVDLSVDGAYGWAVVPLKDFKFQRGGGRDGDRPVQINQMMLRPNLGTSSKQENAGTVGLRSVVLQNSYSELYVADKTTDSITFKWDAETSGNVTAYRVQCNGKVVATVNNTTYEARNLVPGTFYNYQIYAMKGNDAYAYTKVLKLKTHDLVSETSAEHIWYKADMTNWNASAMLEDTNNDRVSSQPKTVASWGKTVWEYNSWNSGWMRAINGGNSYGITSENLENTAVVVSIWPMGANDNSKKSAMRIALQPVGSSLNYNLGADVVIPGQDKMITGEWNEFVIPLSQLRAPEGFEWSTVGEFSLWRYDHTNNVGTGTYVLLDNVRLTALNPEIRSIKFTDEDGNMLFTSEGVIPASVRNIRLHFNRGLDAETLEGIDVTANGVSVVKSRTYDASNYDVNLTLGELPSEAAFEIKVNGDNADEMLLSNITAGICSTDDKGTPVVDINETLQTPAAKYSLKLKVEKYSVLENAMFVDEAGDQMGMYFEEATVFAKADKTSANAEFVIVAAVYEDNMLKSVVTKNVSKSDAVGEHKTEAITLTGEMSAKLFVFNNLDAIKPLTDMNENTQIVPWVMD